MAFSADARSRLSSAIRAGLLMAGLAAASDVRVAAQGTRMRPADLLGQWQLTSIQQTPGKPSAPAVPASYTIEFRDGGSFVFRADCNKGTGSYRIVGGRLQLTLGTVTRVRCRPGSYSTAMLGAIDTPARATLVKGVLTLAAGKAYVAVFTPLPKG